MAKLVTIFGGTGFIGRHIAAELAKAGFLVRACSRLPQEADLSFITAGTSGCVTTMAVNINNPTQVAKAVKDADIVINCVGILYETSQQHFNELQSEAAGRIAKAAKDAKVSQLIYISALLGSGADKSEYGASKLEGERKVREQFPHAVIIRPSVVFGPEDNFINKFAKIVKLSPIVPLVNSGKPKFQPVYVGDLVAAICKICKDNKYNGSTFELAGPEILSLRQIHEAILNALSLQKPMMPLPKIAGKMIALLSEFMPVPMLTFDQLKLLNSDNVLEPKEQIGHFEDLDITPRCLGAIIGNYLK